MVAQGDGAQAVHHTGQHGVGLQHTATPRAHVRRADEQQRRRRTAVADAADLPLNAHTIPFKRLVIVNHGHGVAAELEDDHPHIGLPVVGAQQGVGDEGELLAGGAPQGDVVHRDTISVIQHDAVEVGVALHGDLHGSGGRIQLPMACMNAHKPIRACIFIGAHAVAEGGCEVAVTVVVEQGDVGEALHTRVGVFVAGGVGREGGATRKTVALAHESVVAFRARALAVGRVERQRTAGRLADSKGGDSLDNRHQSGTAAAEKPLEIAAQIAGDTVHLDLRVAVVQHTDHLLVATRPLHAPKQSVEEGDVVVGKVELPCLLGQCSLVVAKCVLDVVEPLLRHGIGLLILDFQLGLVGAHQHLFHRRKVQFFLSNAHAVFRKKEDHST